MPPGPQGLPVPHRRPLVSGPILAVMVIPIIASTSRDLIRGLPIPPREGAGAPGMPDAETFYAPPGQAQVYLSHGPARPFVMVLIVIILGRVAVSLSRRHAG
jgi:ABC-type phosphate transport system permease subunit